MCVTGVGVGGDVDRFVGVFPRKGFGDPPPPPLPPQKSTKLPRARKGPQKQNNRYPLQMLAVKVQYLRVLSIFEAGGRGGFSHGPVRAPRNETNSTLLKG